MKILIVDDEIPIREWIAYSIQKQNIECEIVGLAKNGREAMQIFLEKKPDLIFTDIKMPVMDGIEFLNNIKSSQAQCYKVILTSHSDFEYARKALELNADEYILKTEIDDKSIMKIMDKYKIKLRDSVRENRVKTPIAVDSYIDDILESDTKDSLYIAELLKRLEIDLDDGFLLSISLKLDGSDIRDKLVQIDNLDKCKYIKKKNLLIYNNILVLLISLDNIPSKLNQMETVHELANLVNEIFHTYVSVSTIGRGYKQIGKVINESCEGLKLKFYNKPQNTVFADGNYDFQNYKEKLDNLKEKILILIEKKNSKQAERIFEDLVYKIKQYEIRDMDFVKRLIIQIVHQFVLVYISRKTKDLVNKMQEIEIRLEEAEDYDKLICLAKEEIEEIIVKNPVYKEDYSSYIKKTIIYTKNNYNCIENISEVSDQLNINSQYFCRLFKKEVGCTYITYLNDLRLTKAMELLKNTNMKIYEIADKVGYNNISYFSKSFKKKYNINPLKHRIE